jgi:hypothetical protein
MPRGRGGVRTGTPGHSYPNRTDLASNSGAPLPAQAPPSTQYGQASASLRSQAAVPLAPQSGPAPVAPPAASGPAPIPPGGFGDPLRPTDRPGEPVTAGLPLGPGAGPEALTMNQVTPTDPILTTLAALSALGPKLNPALRVTIAQLQSAQNNGMRG